MDCVTAGNVMVQLFLQTKPAYFLNNKKLQYLLCIAQMMSLSAGRPLFPDSFRNLKNDLSLEAIADSFVYNTAIQEGGFSNHPLSIDTDSLVIPFSTKKIYEIKEDVSDEAKKTLIRVFLRFGGYQEKQLRKILNAFTPLRSAPVWSYIPKEDVMSFLEEALVGPNPFPGNPVFALCQQCYAESIPPVEELPTESESENDVPEQTTLSQAEPFSDAAVPLKEATPVLRNALKDFGSYHLDRLVVGKCYSLYVESTSDTVAPVVKVVSLTDKSLVPGVLTKMSNTVYRYSFLGVASDIKVVLDF